jgi:actin-related protein 6
MSKPVLIFDNGAGSIKAGWHHLSSSPQSHPNATAKVSKSMQYLISDQLKDCLNTSSLQLARPFDRGYLNNWQCELEVWSYLFQDKYKVNPAETSFVVTEPLCNLESIQNDTNEVVFEYFGFSDYLRRPAAAFSAYHQMHIASSSSSSTSPLTKFGCTILDSGFSFTHIVPFIGNKCVKHAIRRVNIGGKLLSNYLKELVSYRQWNMMDEFLLMENIKEALCFVSDDLVKHLAMAKGWSKAVRAQKMLDHSQQRLR